MELENELKRNVMQIVTQGIENMFITFIIHDYGVEKNELQKDTFSFHLKQISN
jgi:hypothetical protein